MLGSFSNNDFYWFLFWSNPALSFYFSREGQYLLCSKTFAAKNGDISGPGGEVVNTAWFVVQKMQSWTGNGKREVWFLMFKQFLGTLGISSSMTKMLKQSMGQNTRTDNRFLLVSDLISLLHCHFLWLHDRFSKPIYLQVSYNLWLLIVDVKKIKIKIGIT